LAGGIAHAILETAFGLASEHCLQNSIGWHGLADDVVSGQEMEDVAGSDTPVHVLAKSVGPIIAFRTTQRIRQ
jgi:hypothetical protein